MTSDLSWPRFGVDPAKLFQRLPKTWGISRPSWAAVLATLPEMKWWCEKWWRIRYKWTELYQECWNESSNLVRMCNSVKDGMFDNELAKFSKKQFKGISAYAYKLRHVEPTRSEAEKATHLAISCCTKFATLFVTKATIHCWLIKFCKVCFIDICLSFLCTVPL